MADIRDPLEVLSYSQDDGIFTWKIAPSLHGHFANDGVGR